MRNPPSYRKKVVSTSKGKIAYAIVKLNGKVIHLGRWNTKASKQEYERVVGEWLAGGKSENSLSTVVSVTEVCVEYVREMKRRYRGKNRKESDESKNIGRIMKMLRANYGSTSGADFKALRFKVTIPRFLHQVE